MKSSLRFLVLAALAAGTAFAATPVSTPTAAAADRPVTVVFANPDKYADVKENYSDYDNENGREHYLPLLREHLERIAARRLPAGQRLTMTFTDIDLAGDFEPWRGIQFDDIRVVKDIYVPRMNFSFQITDANGQVVKSGERKLVEMAYQMRITGGFRDDPLRYEKMMLDDWMSREFSKRRS